MVTSEKVRRQRNRVNAPRLTFPTKSEVGPQVHPLRFLTTPPRPPLLLASYLMRSIDLQMTLCFCMLKWAGTQPPIKFRRFNPY